MARTSSAFLIVSAFLCCAQLGPAAAQAPTPAAQTKADLVMAAALKASRTPPAQWDWPAAASEQVRKEIIAGNYTPEELRNIFTVLASRSADRWPPGSPPAPNNDGPAPPPDPGMAKLTAPGAINHGRGFRGLEVFYGSNGYGGISGRVDKLDTLIAHGDRVFYSWIIEGRHTNKLFGFPGSGKMLQVRENAMQRFKDGQVVESDFLGDDLALYAQAGGKLSFPDKP